MRIFRVGNFIEIQRHVHKIIFLYKTPICITLFCLNLIPILKHSLIFLHMSINLSHLYGIKSYKIKQIFSLSFNNNPKINSFVTNKIYTMSIQTYKKIICYLVFLTNHKFNSTICNKKIF
jgi:hypothetical protein